MERLQALVRLPTVSHADEAATDPEPFERFHAALAEGFPLLHATLTLHRVRDHSLLLHWRGLTADEPVVLMAHIDVVPVDETAPWQHPPFGAEIHDGAIWGRGTLDDKGSLVGICAAVERLLAAGHVPARDVWLSFGAREEVSGPDASTAVAELRSRGVTPWFVLDEGGAVAHEAFPGVDPPLGVVGVSEKGTTTIELRAEGRGGSLLDARARRADRPHRARRRTPGEAAVRPHPPRADPGAVRPDRAVRPPRAAPPVRQRPAAAAAPDAGAAAGRGRARRPGAYDDGGDHALRLPGPQRDRLQRDGRGQPADPGR